MHTPHSPLNPAAWLGAYHRARGSGNSNGTTPRMPTMRTPGGPTECRRWRINVLDAGWGRANSEAFVAALLDLTDFLLDGLRRQCRALHAARRSGSATEAAAAGASAQAAAALLDLVAGVLCEFGVVAPDALRCFRRWLADEQKPFPPAPSSARELLQLEADSGEGGGGSNGEQTSLDLFAA